MKFDEFAGWAGVLIVLVAYALVSWGIIQVGVTYQILNAVGAAGLFLISLHKKAYQLVVFYGIWTLIALVHLILHVGLG